MKIADTNPKIRGVFGISFTYKNLQASVNLRYNLGSFAFNSALFNKVEICGVNTSKLPLLSNEEKKELLIKIKMVTKKQGQNLYKEI